MNIIRADQVKVGDIIMVPTGSGYKENSVLEVRRNPHKNWIGFVYGNAGSRFFGWLDENSEVGRVAEGAK